MAEEGGKQDMLLYASDNPECWKVSIMLEELKAPYNLAESSSTEEKNDDLEPTLIDCTLKPPFKINQSGAILMYLAEKFGSSLLPSDFQAKMKVIQWVTWQTSKFAPIASHLIHMKRIKHENDSAKVNQIHKEIEEFETQMIELYSDLNKKLDERDYICGDQRGSYSIADIMCYPHASLHWWIGVNISKFENLVRWLRIMRNKPGVKKGVRVPGKSELGSKVPIFADIDSDEKILKTIEEHETKESYFRVDDLKKLFSDK